MSIEVKEVVGLGILFILYLFICDRGCVTDCARTVVKDAIQVAYGEDGKEKSTEGKSIN